MHTNGYARFLDPQSYIEWYKSLDYNAAREIKGLLGNARPRNNTSPTYGWDTFASMFSIQGGYISGTEDEKWKGQLADKATRLSQFIRFSEEFGQKICVAEWIEGAYAALYYGNPKEGIVVPYPEKYLEYIPETDYSDMTPMEVRAQLNATTGGDTSIVPREAESYLSVKGIRDTLEENAREIDDIKAQMNDVKEAKTGELAELRAQIDAMKAKLEAKQDALMAELDRKKAEMEETKERLEQQIFLLDAQIYSIRCYAGEVVDFAHLRVGKNAPDTEPIVVHQKLRFLDEELGKLASLYQIEWDELDMFERFLQHHPKALDTFAPNDRCIMLVRLSRSGTQLGRSQTFPYSNMLERYKYLHGKTVGIIIRNGENLYLGWTDEDRVHIDDDLIITQAPTISETPDMGDEHISSWEREQRLKEWRTMRKRIMDGYVSRSFVYNTLQGIVDNTRILPLPSGVKLSHQSQYVTYAVADTWLEDKRFGSLPDIIKAGNERATKGDMILTVQSLRPEPAMGWSGRLVSQSYHNDRGRGDRNRTHDCHINDCTIYPINLVEVDEPVDWIDYTHLSSNGSVLGPFAIKARQESAVSDYEGYEVKERYTEPGARHVYVSVLKEYSSWRDTESRANFEVEEGEYINLTYLHSLLLEYVITNKQLGGWRVGGKEVDYAHAIRYLNTAMDYIREREKSERAFIDAVDPDVCKDDEWPMKLSEWKLAHNVRSINEYQAKRFVKYIKGK